MPVDAHVVYVTEPAYPARGRDYGAEDTWLVSSLPGDLMITLVSPVDLVRPELLPECDLVVVRNSGPVAGHTDAWEAFTRWATDHRQPTYNDLSGRGDMRGKEYLLELTGLGMPVIPTVASVDALDRLPAAASYVVKPLDGADSHGLRILTSPQLDLADPTDLKDVLIQPWLPLAAEISFYVVDGEISYALRTRTPDARWDLVPHHVTPGERDFVDSFLRWNPLRHGIQRVDACLTASGDLLLVELEDLNPYLSLDRLEPEVRERFVDQFAAALRRAATDSVAAPLGTPPPGVFTGAERP